MKKFFLFLFVLSQTFCVNAQVNLVPNPSFEDTVDCASNFSSPNAAYPWFNPTASTPDYYSPFSNCGFSSNTNPNGFQLANDGQAYCGIYVYISGTVQTRDYLEVKLSSALLAGRQYRVSFMTSLANTSGYAADRIGAYLSSDSLIDHAYYDTLFATPQIENSIGNILTDTVNWQRVSGTYTATGGELFLTIGNFYDNNGTSVSNIGGSWTSVAYYYIDSVSVAEIPTSIAAESDFPQLKLVPNPSNGKVQLSGLFSGTFKVTVNDVTGRTCMRLDNQNSFYLDVVAGVYFIHIEQNGILSTKILIIN